MLLIANNISSIALILVLFWLAHENSFVDEPYAKAVSWGYGIWALLVAAVMLFRNVPSIEIEWLTVIAKFVIVFTLGAVLLRLKKLYSDE